MFITLIMRPLRALLRAEHRSTPSRVYTIAFGPESWLISLRDMPPMNESDDSLLNNVNVWESAGHESSVPRVASVGMAKLGSV